jgi:uncharacterized DUF497 family protein
VEIIFDWDEEKAKKNKSKHKISFHEAATIFADPLIATMFDPDHSDEEDRFISIGRSLQGRLLVVSYTERDGITRLISCRKAEPVERRKYEKSDDEI